MCKCGGAGASTPAQQVPVRRCATRSPKPYLGFSANLDGNGARHDGHDRLPWFVHLRKQPKQKLC
eukprot:360622-Chlamydomonas_euryale.AAC.4